MQENRPEKPRAVALRYDEEKDMAPVVVAKGQGYLAERIKEIATQYGVPLKQDRQLADYLMALDLYQEIPPELYAVVAELLAFIYSMDRRFVQT